ncbi:Endonuclease/exonuclease/phosphatase [Crucibulum laeve]|uniref:Endonuclease/exonuclease/phosphatase n=1 Tax=Crucibulum laeve TaxID=68775 RepID=A0A5C3LR77_9AGAR|nr:Endonuclease/exonuclease/phosphatase [Crucibulum laeve]
MERSEVDSDSLAAVGSLRSKFEQLASSSTSITTRSGPVNAGGQGYDLLSAGPSSPRPRASSNTFLDSTSPAPHHLRTSSSSSDLKAPAKRQPPPPPPPRGSKAPSRSLSPAPSALTRPVPIPPSVSSSSLVPSPSPRIGTPNPERHVATPTFNVEEEFSQPSVTALKNRFSSASPSSTRASSYSQPHYPPLQRDPPLPSPKPAIPPRPSKIIEPPLKPTILLSTHSVMKSPEQYSPSNSSPHTSVHSQSTGGSSTDNDSSSSLPPPIPSRIQLNGQHVSATSIRNLDAHFGDSSRTSFDKLNDSSTSLPKSTRSSIPPPPPRHRASFTPAVVDNLPAVSATMPNPKGLGAQPPRLPVRRSTVAQPEEASAAVAPRVSARPQVAIPPSTTVNDTASPASAIERKAFGLGKLPPPPTRTIALGDKLPPARRATEPSSDEESGSEEDPKVQAADMMPDSSRSSRRPPVLTFHDGYPSPRIHVHPHNGIVAASGSYIIVAHSHHLKIYDVAISEAPKFSLDTKDAGVKDSKITSLALRPAANEEDCGFILWVGTKEGHLFEVDIRTGTVIGTKPAAHMHPITYLFRHADSMVSMDESGKTLIFAPDTPGGEITLPFTIPRATRTTEKQDFVKMIAGKLWTGARGDYHGAQNAQKLPIIRVYDVMNPASTGRSLLPTEHVGPVTSGTVLPSRPGFVYLGHEEGFITIWDLDSDDGFPKCIEVMRVSTSDILSLEGVNDRLWAGGRNGMISAYDVSHKPWLVTNSWNAHPGLPVMKLMVNHYAIERNGRLCVVSVGRDEQLRLWDGLLGLDWVDKELLKTEAEYSTFRELSVLLVSWNCDSARPDSLNGDAVNYNFLQDVLQSVDSSPDILAFGFQEVIDLESRKMTAKNVLLGSKRKEDMGLSDKVTGAYKRWYDRLVTAVRIGMPPDVLYSVVHTESLVGLFSCIFVKNTERASLDDVAVTTVKRGMGGRYGNKGGIVARFVIGDSSICLINCHLAAGQNATRRRNADAAGILEDKAVFPVGHHSLAYVGGGDGTMVLDHDIVFFQGDMNYRIDHRRDAIISAIRSKDYASLLPYDQLLREIKYNRGCRLRGFAEGPITFAPTYKYDPRSDQYDTSEKHRSPAWCDRILWRTRVPTRVRQLHYRRYETNVSDHRPISAAFTITVKTLQQDARQAAQEIVEAAWIDEQERLLQAAREFYQSQALV